MIPCRPSRRPVVLAAALASRVLGLLPALLLVACEPSGLVGDDDVADDDSGAADDDVSGDDDVTADDDTSGDDDDALAPPDWCEAAQLGAIQDVTTTPAAPYFVHHPADGSIHVPIVIFLPGGSGSQAAGMGAFTGFLADAEELQQIRAVVLYSTDGNLLDEYPRSIAVLDEVLQCFGGDAGHVHLAGTSNGGMGACDLMLDQPEPFATLAGAPGLFSSTTPGTLTSALSDKAVFNGVGEQDYGWLAAVQAQHAELAALGIDSTLAIFAGQGHTPDASFDERVLYDFWLSH